MMYHIKTIVLFISVSIPSWLHAQGSLGVGTTLSNPINAGSVQAFIRDILDVVVQIGVPIAVLFVIYAGFLFVTAQGSEDKIKTAKSAFFWAIIGAAVLLGAKVIVDAIVGTVNQI